MTDIVYSITPYRRDKLMRQEFSQLRIEGLFGTSGVITHEHVAEPMQHNINNKANSSLVTPLDLLQH